VIAPTLGFPLGIFVVAGIFAAFHLPMQSMQAPYLLHPMPWLPILAGLGLAALFQHRAIRDWIGAPAWVLATLVGFTLAIATQDLPFHPHAAAGVVALYTGAVIGACVGAVQSLVLRRALRTPVGWILVRGASLALVALAALLLTRGQVGRNALTPLVAFGIIAVDALLCGLYLRGHLIPPAESGVPAT